MANAPAWLRCENCLWWRSAGDPGEPWGCCWEWPPRPAENFDRCHHWTCKRCLEGWNDVLAISQANHLHCRRVGRGKGVKHE